jgi:hypothetical protein
MLVKKLIEKVDFDITTGLPFIDDIRGNLHLLNWADAVNISGLTRINLQSDMKNYTWATSSDYNRIPDTIHPGPNNYLTYTVPAGYDFHLSYIIAVAIQRETERRMTVVGLFVNGNLRSIVSFVQEVQYVLSAPLVFHEGTSIEFKIKPGIKGQDFGINTGGYLVESV